MSEKLTNEQVQARAEELEKVHGCKIHPLVFMTEEGGEQIVGYMKEPPRIVKLRVLDKSITGPMTAASECLESVLIKEASDPRILSESPENDKVFLGACVAATKIIELSTNQFKKK
ncbi:hypothetical protein F0L74_09750 [Chitinophaga agrisoli]|uniref:Uncharacterized protein n=1 Tax=Chitinophaga agrisoli TaxID=2607653 RepID=A0A5B2VWW1_9BACT|nr:hypothetical protein [Chitinophaga agrisoli]KAA2242802.1 hypothetical protein F0L74_09750 [Chitinophaga agrisoli]